MKSRVAFTMLNFAKHLKAAGVEPKIADAQAQATLEVIVGLLDENLATKQDFKLARQELLLVKSQLQNNILQSQSEVRQEISALREDLRLSEVRLISQIGTLETDLTSQMGTLETRLTSQIGTLETRLITYIGKTVIGSVTAATAIVSLIGTAMHFLS